MTDQLPGVDNARTIELKRPPVDGPTAADIPAADAARTASRTPATRGATVVAAIATVAALVFAGLWLSTRSDLNSAMQKVVAFESVAEEQAAAAAARPDLAQAVADHELSRHMTSGNASAVSLNFTEFNRAGSKAMLAFLDELGFNGSAVLLRISNTRALDGTQSERGTNVTATWTYHPDDGVNIILEAD